MKCPRCVQRIHRAATACPHCGFSLRDVDEWYGSEDVSLKKFTDSAGVLRFREREVVKQVLEQFEDQFPQLFFAIYIGAFTELPSIRQFGFWLLNRAAFSDVGLDRPNSNGVLLVLDVNGKVAGMSFGYGLMPFLNEKSTFEILSAAHPFLLMGDHLKALKVVVKKTRQVLKKMSKRAARNPEEFLRARYPSQEVGDLVRKIRAGNKKAGEIETSTEEVDDELNELKKEDVP